MVGVAVGVAVVVVVVVAVGVGVVVAVGVVVGVAVGVVVVVGVAVVMKPLAYFLTGLLCGWIITGQAELIRVRVLLSQPQQVEEWYPEVVMAQVKERFREDLGIRMRVKFRKSYKVPHSYDLDLADDDFGSYLKKVRRSKVWIKLALVPAYWRDGIDYSAGFGIWDFALATIRQTRLIDGADRFDHDWITISHELCHAVNGEHIDFVPNIMEQNALAYAGPELRFLAETKREVRRFLKERA